MRHALAVAAVSLVALLAAMPAQAADEEIVVTGRGLADRPGDRAFDVVTVGRDDIAVDPAQRLESVLGDVAGVQQFRRLDSRSANPTSQGISLRGIGGNAASRGILILDGVPQADPFFGYIPFAAYATDRIGRVRVTRGGGSGYYGSGALAGTVELESATPDAARPVSFAGAYGSRNSVDTQGSASLVRDGGFATLSGSYQRGDGFVPIVAESRGPVDRPSPYRQISGAGRAVVGIGAGTELQATIQAFDDRRERGTDFSVNHAEGADASVRLAHRGDWGWQALAYVQTRNFSSQVPAINAARSTATPTLNEHDTPATALGARVEVAPPLGTGRDLRLGADVRAMTGRTEESFTYVAGLPTRERRAGGDARTVGLFADGSAEMGRLTLSLGGRVDWWQLTSGSLREVARANNAVLTNVRFADRSGTQATGRAGVAFEAAKALTLRASAYRGWRLPTLNELYRPFRAGTDATAANAGLDPERLTGVDAGATFTPTPDISLAATVFWNRLAGAIANVTQGNGPGNFPLVGFVAAGGAYRVRQNLDAIRSTGLEVDANWSHGPLFARASWSHVNPRVEASGAAAPLDGLRPAQTPRDLVTATLGWRKGTAVIAATVRQSARQFEDDQNSRSLAPATTVGGVVIVPVAGSLALQIRGENLFNERVEATRSATGVVERATPRTIMVGLKLG